MFKSTKEDFAKLLTESNAQILPQSSQSSQACLRSLAFPEMGNRFNDIDPAAEGTCEWRFGHETYRRWVVGERGLLWIRGKPGSGKSTLLRYALRNVIVASNIGTNAFVLSFFFHGRDVELQRTPLGCFRSLLQQLLSRVPDKLPDLVAAFENYRRDFGEPGEKWQWHLRELQDFFKSSLERVLENRPVWLFVDALDESGKENAVNLVKELKSLVQTPPSTKFQFRICFSCRHYPNLDQDCQFNIKLERQNRGDISTYVRTQLSASNTLTASTIPDLITERADGVFMWARLVVNRALGLDNEGAGLKKIEAMVNSIHPELDELYCGLVQSIDDKPASLKLIRWICFAKRPLSLDELRWALVVDVVDANYPCQSLQQCENAEDYTPDCDTMERKLKTLSCGLAEAVPSSDTRVVQFIHQSVKDFFPRERPPSSAWQLKLGRYQGLRARFRRTRILSAVQDLDTYFTLLPGLLRRQEQPGRRTRPLSAIPGLHTLLGDGGNCSIKQRPRYLEV